MNSINFNQVGGIPLSTNILSKMQTAYAIFNALGNIVGDKSIISGCVVQGSSTTDGIVFVNGEIFEFRGGVTQATILIKEDVEALLFENQTTKPAIKTRYVTFGSGVDSLNWADFKSGYFTKDIVAGLAGKADQNSFNALADAFALVFTKLLTIEEGARKQLQADFAETDNTKVTFIKNKTGLNALAKGTIVLGDAPAGASTLLVSLGVTLPNANYMVVLSPVSLSTSPTKDDDVIFLVREKTTTSFTLMIKELQSDIQNLNIDYIVIPL